MSEMPVSQPQIAVDEFAISPAWEAHKDFRAPFKYKLEKSGQTLLIHHVDMTDILKLGVANELDFMSKALMGNEQPEKTNAQDAVKDAIQKADSFEKMVVMVDKVCLAGIVKPKIHPVPPPDGDGNPGHRQPGLFYVDQIPWDDRMELFSVIYESEGLSDFREEQEPGVGNVEHVPSVQLPADGPVADVRSPQSEGVLSQ